MIRLIVLLILFVSAMGAAETCGPYYAGSFYCATPNMGLTLPTVGVETGPNYAYDINNALNLLDTHNHSPGSGVPVPASGLNINGDISFQAHNATTLRSCRFSAQSLFSSSSDNGSLFESGTDLYYRDGSGNNIRLTQLGAVAPGPATANANTVYAGPTSGPSGSVTMRSLVSADLPSVTNSNLATMPANTIKGNNTGSSAAPSDLTVAQVAAMLTAPTLSIVTASSHSGGFPANSSGTYTTPANVRYIRVRMVGGGGGGSGSGTASGGGGGAGGATTFGTSLLSAGGGGGGAWNSSPGSGGSSSLGTGPVGFALSGAPGGGYQNNASSGAFLAGGGGGNSAFGGAGGATTYTASGENAIANTGGGGSGGGASATASCLSGAGGGAGGYVDAIIASPSATYSYSVGGGGTVGTAGTNGFAGGTGGSGLLIVEEHYQ